MQLEISQSVEDELDLLWDTDSQSAADIDAIIEELLDDPDLCDRLSQNGFSTEKFNALRYEAVWKKGYNMYRLRAFSVAKYRLIYAHDPSRDRYAILALMPRGLEYDHHHPTIQRAITEYQTLGFPLYASH